MDSVKEIYDLRTRLKMYIWVEDGIYSCFDAHYGEGLLEAYESMKRGRERWKKAH